MGFASEDHDLLQSVQQQIEYYFSPQNLVRDTFLHQVLAANNGCAPVSVIASFPKLQQIYHQSGCHESIEEVIMLALEHSRSVLVTGGTNLFIQPYSMKEVKDEGTAATASPTSFTTVESTNNNTPTSTMPMQHPYFPPVYHPNATQTMIPQNTIAVTPHHETYHQGPHVVSPYSQAHAPHYRPSSYPFVQQYPHFTTMPMHCFAHMPLQQGFVAEAPYFLYQEPMHHYDGNSTISGSVARGNPPKHVFVQNDFDDGRSSTAQKQDVGDVEVKRKFNRHGKGGGDNKKTNNNHKGRNNHKDGRKDNSYRRKTGNQETLKEDQLNHKDGRKDNSYRRKTGNQETLKEDQFPVLTDGKKNDGEPENSSGGTKNVSKNYAEALMRKPKAPVKPKEIPENPEEGRVSTPSEQDCKHEDKDEIKDLVEGIDKLKTSE